MIREYQEWYKRQTGLSGGQRVQRKPLYLAAIIGIISAAFALVLLLEGLVAALVYGALCLGLLFVTKAVWLPEHHGKARVWRATVAGIVSIGALYLVGKHWINDALIALGVARPTSAVEELARAAVAIACVAALAVVTRSWERSAPAASPPMDDERQRELGSFRRVLATALRHFDQQLAWIPSYFEPLSVEVDRGGGRRKRVSSLFDELSGLRANDLALLLGTPGAGKSVSLREFAVRQLEASRSGRTPLYVSLDGWRSEPTAENLRAYVEEWVRQLAPSASVKRFMEAHFDRMLAADGWLLILDGFDEIPALLDATDSDVLLKCSSAVAQFAASSQCPTVVASRMFRHPQLMTPHTRYVLVSLTERQMDGALARAAAISSDLRRRFLERQDLVSVARAPFFLGLIREYLETKHALPSTRLDLFRSYLESRFADVATPRVSASALDEACVVLSRWMFHADRGLEIEVADVGHLLPQGAETLTVLHRARLVRLDDERTRVAFAHRRFGEYFAAKHIDSLADLHTADVLRDTRWREVIALRCEVAGDGEARAFAERLFTEIEAEGLFQGETETEPAVRQRALSVLRFLRDAFSMRPSVLAAYQDRLGELATALPGEKDVFRARCVVELVAFLPADVRERTLAWALACEAPVIQETAFRLARFSGPMSIRLRKPLLENVAKASVREFFQRMRDWSFVLGLSAATRGAVRFIWVRAVSLVLLGLSIALTGAVATGPAIFWAGIAALLYLLPRNWSATWARVSVFAGLLLIGSDAGSAGRTAALAVGSMAAATASLADVTLYAVIAVRHGWRWLWSLVKWIAMIGFGVAMQLLVGATVDWVRWGMVVFVVGMLGYMLFESARNTYRWWSERRRVDAVPLPRTTPDVEETLKSLEREASRLRYLDRVMHAGVSVSGEWSGWHKELGLSHVSSRLLELSDRSEAADRA